MVMASMQYSRVLPHRAILSSLEDLACGNKNPEQQTEEFGSASTSSSAAQALRDAQAMLVLERLSAAQDVSGVPTDDAPTITGRMLRLPLRELAKSLDNHQHQDGAATGQNNRQSLLVQAVQRQLALSKERLMEAVGHPEADAADLPRHVLQLQTRVRDLAARREKLLSAVLEERGRYVCLLADAAGVLARVVRDHKATDGKSAAACSLELLQSTGRMLGSKLQVLTKRVAADTYTPGDVASLTAVDRELSRAELATSDALQKVRAKLGQYNGLGGEYDDLAARYSKVLEEVAHARYALQQMRQLQKDI